MIAVDTNILIYAHREESPWYETAYAVLERLVEDRSDWAIPWPSIHEFLAIVTHPRIYDPPSTRDQALQQVDEWLGSPVVQLLSESTDHWSRLKQLITIGQISGPKTHDAKIAALCLGHGVAELWTVDRDFSRFPDLTCRNPLL
jgi:hypothetical protein